MRHHRKMAAIFGAQASDSRRRSIGVEGVGLRHFVVVVYIPHWRELVLLKISVGQSLSK
jgi:hypothetical protein